MNSTPRVTFDNGGAFIRETRREVEAYLADRWTRVRGYILLYVKPPIAIGLTVVAWAVLMLASPGATLAWACIAALAVGSIITAFCVQHDANHGAYFRKRRWNHLLGWSADALLGFSSYAWRVKHNVAHHTYTNVHGYDDDVTQTPMMRLVPEQAPRRHYRLQQFYIWPLYSLMGLRMQWAADISALLRGHIGQSAIRRPRGWDLVGLVTGKVVFIAWALALPMLVYPWWLVLGVYVGCVMVLSLIMAVTFQLAHCVEEASFPSASELVAEKRLWAVHEVESTVNFCPRNPVLTWFLGGLNYQIEHHLFPRVPHTHYPRIARIVREASERHGVRYTTTHTLREALSSHARHLREMGRAGLPVEIEMG